MQNEIVSSPVQKSQFWKYKIYNSKYARKENQIVNSKGHCLKHHLAQTKWAGPFYFDNPVDAKAVREWIRSHLGINNSEHIEVKISNSECLNKKAKSVEIRRKLEELAREAGFKEAKLRKARPGNFVVKVLVPKVSDFSVCISFFRD